MALTPNPSPNLGEGSRVSDGVRVKYDGHSWCRLTRDYDTLLKIDGCPGLGLARFQLNTLRCDFDQLLPARFLQLKESQ